MRSQSVLPGVFVAIMTAMVLFTLAGYQVTTETAGTRFLSRIAGAVIEVDRWLPAHQEDIELLARDRPQAPVRINDLPIPTTIPAILAIDSDAGTLRRVILDSMGASLYEDGTSAFRDAEGDERAPGLDEPVYWAVTFLNRDAHGLWRIALPVAVLLLVALGANVLRGGRQLLTPVAVGAAIASAMSFGVWLLATAGTNAFESPIEREVMFILRDGAWVGLRNSLAVGVAATALSILLRSFMGQGAYHSAVASTTTPPDFPAA